MELYSVVVNAWPLLTWKPVSALIHIHCNDLGSPQETQLREQQCTRRTSISGMTGEKALVALLSVCALTSADPISNEAALGPKWAFQWTTPVIRELGEGWLGGWSIKPLSRCGCSVYVRFYNTKQSKTPTENRKQTRKHVWRQQCAVPLVSKHLLVLLYEIKLPGADLVLTSTNTNCQRFTMWKCKKQKKKTKEKNWMCLLTD